MPSRPRWGADGGGDPVLAQFTLVHIGGEQEAWRARRCVRELARLAGLDDHERMELVAAVTELTRELTASDLLGSITLRVTDDPALALVVSAEWGRPAAATAPERRQAEIITRLARFFTAEYTPGTTRLTMVREVPVRTGTTGATIAGQFRAWLRTAPPTDPLEELHTQDQELLGALDALRAQQNQLHRAARELEETNRGVVALYGELDAAVSKLRSTAHTLQQAMLTEPPSVEGIDICVRYRPAGARDGAEAGGDWYDVFRLSDGDLAVVVGDVVGHDTRAAATMGQLRAMLRGLAYHDNEQPHRALESLDRLVRTMRLTSFATSIYARLHTGSLEEGARGVVMSWANAGHPGLIAIRPDGTSSLVEIPRQVALGVADRVARSVCRRWFPVGSTILLFSDGLYERRGEDLDLSVASLLQRATVNAHRPLVELCDVLVDNAPDEDDLVLVALRLTAPGGSPAARAGWEAGTEAGSAPEGSAPSASHRI